MNKLLIIFLTIISPCLVSCEVDEKIEIIKMRVNHYQQPVNNAELFYGLSFLVQEGDEIGNDEWFRLHNHILGFDYQLGSIYEIEVLKKHTENPMIDMPSVEYTFIRTLSKTKVSKETTFKITLSIEYFNGFESLVTKNDFSKFNLLGNTEINCGNLCSTLEENIENQKGMIGIFKHIDNSSIELLALESKEE